MSFILSTKYKGIEYQCVSSHTMYKAMSTADAKLGSYPVGAAHLITLEQLVDVYDNLGSDILTNRFLRCVFKPKEFGHEILPEKLIRVIRAK